MAPRHMVVGTNVQNKLQSTEIAYTHSHTHIHTQMHKRITGLSILLIEEGRSAILLLREERDKASSEPLLIIW